MSPELDTPATADQPADVTGAQQSQDQAATTQTGVAASEGSPSESDTAQDQAGDEPEAADTDDEGALLSTEQIDALKGDPAKLIKELNRAATKKFQQLATERKALEPFKGLIDALTENPRDAVMALAQQVGLQVADPQAQATEDTAQKLSESVMSRVRETLGPDYEDLADKLAPVMLWVAQEAAKTTTQPLVQQQEDILRQSAVREMGSVLEAFAKKHPDLPKHEKAMAALAEKLPPGKGVSEPEYLEMLYALATRDTQVAERTKKTIARMSTSAQAATKTTTAVGGDKVVAQPGKLLSWDEAASLARQGVRVG